MYLVRDKVHAEIWTLYVADTSDGRSGIVREELEVHWRDLFKEETMDLQVVCALTWWPVRSSNNAAWS